MVDKLKAVGRAVVILLCCFGLGTLSSFLIAGPICYFLYETDMSYKDCMIIGAIISFFCYAGSAGVVVDIFTGDKEVTELIGE